MPEVWVHEYLSTACEHAQHSDNPAEARLLHAHCNAMVGYEGVKRPARCKWCDARCQCACHRPGA